MYALPNKTQHKLIVKVRGGISQKLDEYSSNSPTRNTNGDTYSKSQSSFSSASTLLSSSSSSSSSSNSAFGLPSSKKVLSLSRHIDEAGFNAELSHLPQPVFHSINQHGNKQKSLSNRAHKQQFITPEHNEMIKYVHQSWKGVECDYKKSVSNVINKIDINSAYDNSPSLSASHLKQKQVSAAKKKTATISTPLLLSGSYHHTSSLGAKDSGTSRQDSFQPFDLEAFWGNRILKRLTGDI